MSDQTDNLDAAVAAMDAEAAKEGDGQTAPTTPEAAAPTDGQQTPAPAPVDPQAPAEPAPQGDQQAPAPAEPAAPQPDTPPADVTPAQLWKRMGDVDTENRQLKAQLRAITDAGVDIAGIKEQAQTDPVGTLQKLGFTVESALELLTSGLPPAAQQDPVPAVADPSQVPPWAREIQETVTSLRKSHEEIKQAELRRAEYGHLEGMLANDTGDRWQMIRAKRSDGSLNMVIDTAVEAYNRYQRGHERAFIGREAIMDQVEQHLLQQERAKILGITSPNLPSKLLADPQVAAVLGQRANSPAATNGQTNGQQAAQAAQPAGDPAAPASGGTPTPTAFDDLPESEQIERALAAMDKAAQQNG
jgi:hypothetical protein